MSTSLKTSQTQRWKKKGSKRSHSEDFFLKLLKFYKARALILLSKRQSSKILRSNKKDTSFLSSVLKVLPSYSLDFHSVKAEEF